MEGAADDVAIVAGVGPAAGGETNAGDFFCLFFFGMSDGSESVAPPWAARADRMEPCPKPGGSTPLAHCFVRAMGAGVDCAESGDRVRSRWWSLQKKKPTDEKAGILDAQ